MVTSVTWKATFYLIPILTYRIIIVSFRDEEEANVFP